MSDAEAPGKWSAEFLKPAEAACENGAVEPGRYFSYLSAAGLHFWSIDEDKELASSITSLQSAVQAGLVPETQAENGGQED